ncbi:MAG: hypothetical protein R6U91_01525 [Bacillota bacterium]
MDNEKFKEEDNFKDGNDNYICQKCSLKIAPGKTTFHGIRQGYSPEHFPLYHFKKVPLCADCLERQKKIDVFEKVLASITLGIVFYFMAMGFLVLFNLAG